MTPEWLEAQVKEEHKLGVLPAHSLKTKIKIKVFKNMKFCLNNIYEMEKNKLINLIKELGGQYISQPQNHCVIVSKKKEGNIITLSKGMSGVWIVTPEYVQNCS